MKHKPKAKAEQIDVAALIGRRGTEATIALRNRKAGVMDTRPAWMRTRKGRDERAIAESLGAD